MAARAVAQAYWPHFALDSQPSAGLHVLLFTVSKDFTRTELKDDPFRDVVADSLDYVQENRTKVLTIAAVVIAVVVGGIAFRGYQQRQNAAAREAFAEALRYFNGVVDTEQRAGRVTFATTIEKRNRTTEVLEKLAADFPNRREGIMGKYYLGLVKIEAEQDDEAKPLLQDVANSSDGEAASLARIALGQLLAREGDDAGATVQFQAALDHPSTLVPKEVAQLELGRHLAKSDPENAKPLLQELMAVPGPVGVSAGQALREIGGV